MKGLHTLFIAEVVDADIVSKRPCMTYDYYHQTNRAVCQRHLQAIFQKGRQ